MDRLCIPATERSPAVEFDPATGILSLRGESYPENASAVFEPVFALLQARLAQPDSARLRLEVALNYFNSSSAKALMNIFQMLDTAGAAGADIAITWIFDAEDETMKEFGDDFSEDLRHVRFTLAAESRD